MEKEKKYSFIYHFRLVSSIYASVNVLRELAYSSKNYFCKVWIPKHSYLAEIEIIIHKIDIKN